jgi:hypothetical protein
VRVALELFRPQEEVDRKMSQPLRRRKLKTADYKLN